MKITSLSLAAFVTMLCLPASAADPAAFVEALTANPEACQFAATDCGEIELGTLGPGDCTITTGEYVDFIQFQAVAGRMIAATLRPLSSTFTKPILTLIPPSGDASKTPFVMGRGSLELFYVAVSTGLWTLAVSTDDLFAFGDYVVDLECFPNPYPTEPQNCVTQWLMCGQTAFWNLTSTSCKFTGTTNLYNGYEYWAQGGETISLVMLSTGFRPQLAIYGDSASAVAADTNPSQTRSMLTYRFPSAGSYYIAAISAEPGRVGSYTVTANCSNPGCEYPIVLSSGSAQQIRYGESATLSVTAIGTQPISYSWIDLIDRIAAGSGAIFKTPPLFTDMSYAATASNACGSDTSGEHKVNVEPLRRRPVRR